MQIISYRGKGTTASWRSGILDQGRVLDIATLSHPRDASWQNVRELLQAGPGVLANVLQRASQVLQTEQGKTLREMDIEIGPPIPDPEKIICIGLNYADHIAEGHAERPVAPTFFSKFRNALVGPTSPVQLPRVSTFIDYEGELAVIIGQRCKDVSKQEALSYVAGYSIINDVTARDLQFQTTQWGAGKVLDTFAPMGPGIVPASAIPDPQQLVLTTRVNGIVHQKSRTSEMLFSIDELITFLSSIMTLEAGDIIATGTPAGIGYRRQPPIFLKAGDIVEVEIERIGTIRNKMVKSR